VAAVVTGVADACQAAGCALLGGETAEMPGVYTEGAFDLAGTVVGLTDRDALWPRPADMQAGDALLGLPSSGPHTNGFSLIRRVVAGRNLGMSLADGQPLADALLAPHRCYLNDIDRLEQGGVAIHGLAHITGGGFYDNVSRVLPDHLAAVINADSWSVPPVFRHLVEWSEMSLAEAYRVFNMGVGMVAIIPADHLFAARSALSAAIPMGKLVDRAGDQPPVTIRGV
jgi:phosphoribosylformylglycinamidine cyclo-ligase